MPRDVGDYGGDAAERGRGCRSKISHSFRCRDCGQLFFASRLQVGRAKAALRCPGCGGPGEETEASTKRRVGMSKSMAAGPNIDLIRSFVCDKCSAGFCTSDELWVHRQYMGHITRGV